MSLVLLATHVNFLFVFDFIDFVTLSFIISFGFFYGLLFKFILERILRLFVAFRVWAGRLFLDEDFCIDFAEAKGGLDRTTDLVEGPEVVYFGRVDERGHADS